MIFTSDDVRARLRERPFHPVRIVTTTGAMYDIYHPDLVMTARRFLIIGTPSTEDPTQAEQVTRLALVHLAELKDLPFPAPSSNGPVA